MAAPQQETYDLRDIYCSAYAIARGVDMVGFFKNEKTGYWNFQFPWHPMQQILQEWHSSEPTVNVRQFIAAEKYLRGLMTSQGR